MGKKNQPEDDPYLEVKRDAMVEAREKAAELVAHVTIGRFCFEQHCEMLKLSAASMRARYQSLREVGFDDSQAMGILLNS